MKNSQDFQFEHKNFRISLQQVNGAILVSHGEWEAPEILYKNHSINYWEAEESLMNSYKDFCEENGIEPTEDKFDEYVNKYENVEGYLDDLVWALDGCPQLRNHQSDLNFRPFTNKSNRLIENMGESRRFAHFLFFVPTAILLPNAMVNYGDDNISP